MAGLVGLAPRLPHIWARVTTSVPPIVAASRKLSALVAHVLPPARQAILPGQPISGVLQLNCGGKLIALPRVNWEPPMRVVPNEAAHDFIKRIHETLGTTFCRLIGAHIAAALWSSLHRHKRPWPEVKTACSSLSPA